MFNIFKKRAITNRLEENILYEYVLDEMEKGIQIRGIWAKALAHSDGIESKAESIYMQYRVQSIKDELDALKIAYDEMSKKKLFSFIKNEFNDINVVPKNAEKTKKIVETKKIEKPKHGYPSREDIKKENNLINFKKINKNLCVGNPSNSPVNIYYEYNDDGYWYEKD